MLSGRIFKLVVIPLSSFGILLAIYFRELILQATTSTKLVFDFPATEIISKAFASDPSPNPFFPAGDYVQDNGMPYANAPSSPHLFREDGIVEVNPDGPHPIFEFISRAEAEWEKKLSRASKTLDEAVQEYRRRYRRGPPKGFNAWWNYVESNNIKLPDEYDQIWRDLEPFWGIDPADLRRLQMQQESHKDTYTVGKSDEDPRIRLLNLSFSQPILEALQMMSGAKDFVELLGGIQQYIPSFRAVISPHDSPTLFSDHEIKAAAVDAASKGKYLDLASVAPGKRLGWLSGCSPLSPARQGVVSSTSRSNKNFIFDHLKAMDPCIHPQLFEGHGEFLKHDDPSPEALLVPQFAYCSTMLHHDIQTPFLLSWTEDILPRSDDPPWEQKLDERLDWRGTNTGMWHASETQWRRAQRARLVDMAHDLNGTVKILLPPTSSSERVGDGVNIPKHKLNPALFDISFAGEPVGCHPDLCGELTHIWEWRKRQTAKDTGNYKYILDVDGNAWSSRFKRLITSNSLIFKATVYPEWFYDRIQPWVHYIPIQTDYSDLYDALVFFRGGLYGEGSHEELGRKIATAGRKWSKTFWRKEDITAYLFRLILEYARVMSLDREAMTYTN